MSAFHEAPEMNAQAERTANIGDTMSRATTALAHERRRAQEHAERAEADRIAVALRLHGGGGDYVTGRATDDHGHTLEVVSHSSNAVTIRRGHLPILSLRRERVPDLIDALKRAIGH